VNEAKNATIPHCAFSIFITDVLNIKLTTFKKFITISSTSLAGSEMDAANIIG
jgi:hypothetical protein